MKLILIEYNNDVTDKESFTFELFDNIKNAFDFCKEIKNVKKIDLVDCDNDNIYNEVINNKNTLNYEDNSLLIKQGILSDNY